MLLTTSEVAERLRVHEGTVRRYIRQGRIKAMRAPGPNSHIRVSEEALAEYIEGATVQADTA